MAGQGPAFAGLVGAAVVGRDDGRMHDGVGPEERPPEVVLGSGDLIGQLLEVGQLACHGEDLAEVGLDRRADHAPPTPPLSASSTWESVRARLAAETMALSDASRMDESRPTPHHVVPSAPAHST